MIEGYEYNSDITILDAKYIKSKQIEDTWTDDKMIILYKDNSTGEKKRYIIDNPTYIFYKAEDDVVVDHNLFFINSTDVKIIETPYKDLLKRIAQETGNMEFYKSNKNSGNYAGNNILHQVKEIFNSDMNIEDHYRFRFDKLYENKEITINKAYCDIEVDNKYGHSDFPEMGESPINAISYLNEEYKEIHFFGLEDKEYIGQESLKEELRNGNLFIELKKFIHDHMGFEKAKKVEVDSKDIGWQSIEKFFANITLKSRYDIYDLDSFELIFHFHKEEIVMLEEFWSLVHKQSPDFLSIYNAPFDFPYMVERVRTLGYDPIDIIADKSIPVEDRYVSYWIDTRNAQQPAERGDLFEVSGKIIIVDQLVQLASRRKGQVNFDNLKLDNIANIYAGIKKLEMGKYAKTFEEFPRVNYKMFCFYSIIDSIACYCIEFKIGDIDYLFTKSLVNNTRYSKCHRQTVYLTNRGIKDFYNAGYIMGNNNNKNNPKPPKFPGALVGDPLNNNDYSKVKINGNAINVFNNLDDFDFRSLYPSIMREFNTASNTQIGRILIDKKVHSKENPFDYDKYSRGGQFLEDLQCGNNLEFCHRWFHLASYMEFIEDMKEFFYNYGYIGFMNSDFLIRRNPGNNNIIPMVERKRNNYYINLVTRTGKIKNKSSIIEDISSTAQMDIYDYDAKMRRLERMREENDDKLSMSW